MASSILKLPIRVVIWLMILTACMMSYMLRVNMSINLIAMVNDASLMKVPNAINDEANESESLNDSRVMTKSYQSIRSECLIKSSNASKEVQAHLTSQPDYGPRYNWSGKIQGLILGAFFWGYIVSSMPGGLLAEMVGPTRIVTLSVGSSAILTMLIPAAASLHYGYVIGIRVFLGLLGGVVYPALHCLIARWAPPIERGKFIGALMGGTLGTVVTWPMLGALIEFWGWNWAFIFPGGLVLAWVIIWMIVVTDTPEIHPRITSEEKMFILKSFSGNTDTIRSGTNAPKSIPPYKAIFGSVAFWALAILHFGNTWGLYLLLTAGPMYMSDVLGFELTHSGLLAALPYLARMISGIIFGSIGDVVRKSGKWSVTNIRKTFVTFSHFIPGLFLIGQTFMGCDQLLAVTMLTLALGFNGASTVTNLQNAQDLSSNYAGTIYGIINCIGGTTGFITPMLTGFITEKHNGFWEWGIIFWIGAGVYIVCGLIFCCIGSGEQQAWNIKTMKKEEQLNLESPSKGGIANPAFTCSSLCNVPDAICVTQAKADFCKLASKQHDSEMTGTNNKE